jgi:hypothetical protein
MLPNAQPRTLVLNAGYVTEGLPLAEKKVGKSDNGRKRVRWSIPGAEQGVVEIIGDMEDDADVVAWRCANYDEAGQMIWPMPGNPCYDLSLKIYSKLIDKPEETLAALLSRAKAKGGDAAVEYGPLRLEVDGHFFFVRQLRLAKAAR